MKYNFLNRTHKILLITILMVIFTTCVSTKLYEARFNEDKNPLLSYTQYAFIYYNENDNLALERAILIGNRIFEDNLILFDYYLQNKDFYSAKRHYQIIEYLIDTDIQYNLNIDYITLGNLGEPNLERLTNQFTILEREINDSISFDIYKKAQKLLSKGFYYDAYYCLDSIPSKGYKDSDALKKECLDKEAKKIRIVVNGDNYAGNLFSDIIGKRLSSDPFIKLVDREYLTPLLDESQIAGQKVKIIDTVDYILHFDVITKRYGEKFEQKQGKPLFKIVHEGDSKTLPAFAPVSYSLIHRKNQVDLDVKFKIISVNKQIIEFQEEYFNTEGYDVKYVSGLNVDYYFTVEEKTEYEKKYAENQKLINDATASKNTAIALAGTILSIATSILSKHFQVKYSIDGYRLLYPHETLEIKSENELIEEALREIAFASEFKINRNLFKRPNSIDLLLMDEDFSNILVSDTESSAKGDPYFEIIELANEYLSNSIGISTEEIVKRNENELIIKSVKPISIAQREMKLVQGDVIKELILGDEPPISIDSDRNFKVLIGGILKKIKKGETKSLEIKIKIKDSITNSFKIISMVIK